MAGRAVMVGRSGGAAGIVVLALLTLALPVQAASPVPPQPAGQGWEARQIREGGLRPADRERVKGLPGRAKLGYHPSTGRLRFLSGTPARPLSGALPAVADGRRRLSGGDARDRARSFLHRYGALFGLKDPDDELRVRATRSQPTARSARLSPSVASESPAGAVVRFQQVREGVPVMGGELVVQVSAAGEVLSVSGEVLPSSTAALTTARLPLARARATATSWLARETGRARSSIVLRNEGMALYDAGLMGDPSLGHPGARLVWRIDARLPARGGLAADRRLVLVDAIAGGIVTSISRINTVERRICDNRNVAGRSFLCKEPFRRSEGQPRTRIGDVDAAYILMGVTSDYFSSQLGRDGVDGLGSPMTATVRYCSSAGCPWRNAQWDWAAQQAVFGTGWARADDIVAHEYTHGVLDAEAPFFYQYQSGAINESYADIFGELVDLSHPGGRDTWWTRWKIGEDTPRGAFRDMRDPPRFGHPDRVRSKLWHRNSSDSGGVHRNSGVGNKAAVLIADGGSFRGFSIEGIGRDRMARIYYTALTTRLTSAVDYIDLADALLAACADLAGTPGMTFSHCRAVRDATRATQMHLAPKVWPPRTAPVCAPGRAPLDVLYDDLEDPGVNRWAHQRLAGNKRGWYYPQNPNNNPRWDGSWASSGELNFYAPDRGSRTDTAMRMRSGVLLPPGAYLRFEHGYSFDRDARRRYDGGVVEIRVDDGPWQGVASLFSHGGYNGRIARGSGNRLAGRRAFTGNSRGWASARIDLSAFAGHTLKVRFRMSTDRSVGSLGWYIDDIRIYSCADDSVPPTGSISLDAGAAATTDPVVDVSLTYDDAASWVDRLRVSNSAQVNANGNLNRGITMPVRDSFSWDLTDEAWGGTPDLGQKRVYAQVRDAAGNWSAIFSDAIRLDPPP